MARRPLTPSLPILVFVLVQTLAASQRNCGDTYFTKKGETISYLVYRYFGRDWNSFYSLNPGASISKNLQSICLPKKRCSYANYWNCGSQRKNNKIFPRGLSLNPVLPTQKLNKYSRFKSLGFFLDANGLPKYNYSSVVDWRLSGKVQAVKFQSTCSSCWAFSVTASIESAYSIVNDVSPISLSEQQLIDCSSAKCFGGWPKDAFEYIAFNGGIVPQTAYPFTGFGGFCKGNNSYPTAGAFAITMYEEVNFQGSLGLILALQQQPVIVYVNGGHASFQTYSGGIYEDYDCNPYTVDHSLLAVGYNLSSTPPYWILKNSWGTNWGINGYMFMSITGDLGICGIHSLPGLYPVLPDKSICGAINPCGSGTCYINEVTRMNQCICPPTFINVKNLDGSESCTPTSICTSFMVNPCRYGTCLDDMIGGYTCMCPAQLQLGNYTDGTLTCIPSILGVTFTNYTVQFRDTCYLIANQFGISVQDFLTQNKNLRCDLLQPGTVLNITSKSASCRVSYSISTGDTCDSITQTFSLQSDMLKSLNPGINCSSLVPGQQVCASRGIFSGVPVCTAQQTVYPGDTCQSIMAANGLSPIDFYRMNPGIYCGNLVNQNTTQIPINQVCISIAPLGACACSTGRYYTVAKGDTCSRILSAYYRNSLTLFKSLNCNRSCTNLYTGLRLCRP